jgi:hypothetical protein
MDRKQKKTIHLKITQLLDKHCKQCDVRSTRKSHEICASGCSVGKELLKYGAMLLDSEDKPIVEGNAGNTGINQNEQPVNQGPWTEEEEFYIQNHAHIFDVLHLSKRLNRSYHDVYNKLLRLMKQKKILYFKTRKKVKHGLSG